MPKSLRERWEGSSFVLVMVLIIGSFVAGIQADDWLKGISGDKQDESAKPSEDLRKEIQQVRQENSLLEARLKSTEVMPSASSSLAADYAGLQKSVVELREENQKLRRLCENRIAPSEITATKDTLADVPAKAARFDARLDLGSFCRERYKLDFIRLQEDKLACEKAGEVQSVKLAEACFWSYGSLRYSVEPVSLNVLCDSSAMSDPPCSRDQRPCGFDSRSCCPRAEAAESPSQKSGGMQ